jgi:hypothetical protein
VADIKQAQATHTRLPRVSWRTIVFEKLKQTTPVRVPAGRQTQYIGDAPLLSRDVVRVSSQVMPRGVSSEMTISRVNLILRPISAESVKAWYR